jgi:hypothetical protein
VEVLVGFLGDWKLTYEDMDELVTDNPSLRGMVLGYAAEVKVRKLWFEDDPRISRLLKYDDHDRTKKGDISFYYRGFEFKVEVKSLQTATVKERVGIKTARYQCDASDRRLVTFPNGETLATACLLVGQFDLIAVNLFAFHGDWVFAFAKNEDLPRSTYRDYTEYQREFLLASLMPITWPLQPPYRDEPFTLLDELVEEKKRGEAADIDKEAIQIVPIPKKQQGEAQG